MKYWELIADNLKKAGWSYGYVSALDPEGRTIWIADAHRGDGKRYVVRADDEVTVLSISYCDTRLQRIVLTKQTLCSKNCHPARIADLIAGYEQNQNNNENTNHVPAKAQ